MSLLKKNCCFFDLEVNPLSREIVHLGAVFYQDLSQPETEILQSKNPYALKDFAQNAQYILGHNIFRHDLHYLPQDPLTHRFFDKDQVLIDTLYLSALLFAERPYHALVKDYQLQRSDPADPVKDAQLVRQLFLDCLERFFSYAAHKQEILYNLLADKREFEGFFAFVYAEQAPPRFSIPELFLKIHQVFRGRLCIQSKFLNHIETQTLALAYALVLIDTQDKTSIHPPWILKTYPEVQNLLRIMRNQPCDSSGCDYCRDILDAHRVLRTYFGFDSFRSYEGVALQEAAVQAAIGHQSIMTVFPTGGGKSLTFQVPAFVQGESLRGLTVVISPLQSLMKDQVDILQERFGITQVATLNGLQTMLERREQLEKVRSGQAYLLYIAPESLRSRTILNLLTQRQISRFVVDEAHCFSSWGQSLRVDYLYIGKFIALLQRIKGLTHPISVSCFTATAKKQVVEDIQAYFRKTLNLELREISTRAQRTNLHFEVREAGTEGDKQQEVIKLLEGNQGQGAAIVFVATTKRAEKLAAVLNRSFPQQVKAFHGQMEPLQKLEVQEAFMDGEINIIVATSAFGMGVDKDNVSLVVHFDVPDSLESYIQEAGRAGRNPAIQANCCLLYSELDLKTQFNLINASKLSKKEINQIWRAIKESKERELSISTLELARKAGWGDEIKDLETRVRAAVAVLEESEYVLRGQNQSLLMLDYFSTQPIANLQAKLEASPLFRDPEDRQKAKRIFSFLASRAAQAKALNPADNPAKEKNQVYYFDAMCEHLGLEKADAVRIINLLRQLGLVSSQLQDVATLKKGRSPATDSLKKLTLLHQMERAMLVILDYSSYEVEAPTMRFSIKDLNQKLRAEAGIQHTSLDAIRLILKYWRSRGLVKSRRVNKHTQEYEVVFLKPYGAFKKLLQARQTISDKILAYLYDRLKQTQERQVQYTLESLQDMLNQDIFFQQKQITLPHIDECLRFLHRLEVIQIESGLTVFYTKMHLTRQEDSPYKQFTEEDYKRIKQYYQHKVEQVHIINAYAEKMGQDLNAALCFVEDYFQLPFKDFQQRYFPSKEAQDLMTKPLTQSQFEAVFGALSPTQNQIIQDNQSKHILVAAGPGSGKTRILVHKVASLLLLEDVKPEQFLMLTFSRPAAQEIKLRLTDLVGKLAYFLDVFTYHAYAFALLERPGELANVDRIIEEATQALKAGELPGRGVKHKSVLLVDEYQDISQKEFNFIQALIEAAGDIRFIVVGDDDQNIYAFRGSSVEFMQQFEHDYQAKVYYLQKNYRSHANLVDFNNQFLKRLTQRVKTGHQLISHTQELGTIQMHLHCSESLFIPLVESVIQSNRTGSTAVLTETNEEALVVQTLLNQAGLSARLIMALDQFRLKNLRELRVFSQALIDNQAEDLGLIPQSTWAQAKSYLTELAARSETLPLALEVIDDFEWDHPRLFISDWFQYLDEIRLEDLVSQNSEAIFVSTMHKAKGKEFDQVFILLNQFDLSTDEKKRVLYVAMTRAKQTLILHTNTEDLSAIEVENLEKIVHQQIYAPPLQLKLQLSLKDIHLGKMKTQQAALERVWPGAALQPGAGEIFELRHQNPAITLWFSRAFHQRLARLQKRGYQFQSAKMGYLVSWFEREEQAEYLMPLPEIVLLRPA